MIKRTEEDICHQNEKGEYHKIDGPAYECNNGYKSWYINGKRHREDGPGIIWEDGDVEYYLNSRWYSKKEWEIERLRWLDHRGFPMSANKNY